MRLLYDRNRAVLYYFDRKDLPMTLDQLQSICDTAALQGGDSAISHLVKTALEKIPLLIDIAKTTAYCCKTDDIEVLAKRARDVLVLFDIYGGNK